MNRRNFLRSSAFAAGALSFSARSWSQVTGANDDIRVAVIGFNGQGKSHIEGFRKIPGVRLTALCDVDSTILDREAEKFKGRNEPIETYTDIRKLLESKNVDVISIATPNHWHALGAVWAIQAGKDVYVEKPVSHNVWEGRKIVEAARKHHRIVQTGTQSRSNPGIIEAMQFLHQEKLGKIKLARGLCYKRRASIGKVSGPQQPPASVDYDLWCGPAPKEPLMRSKLHYDWHWVWPTGNGDLGNQGIHQMDLARWALQEKELSPAVFSFGGRFGYEDDGTTPNTQVVYHDYKKAPLIFEVRGLPSKTDSKNMDNYRGSSVGLIVHCENGYMSIPTYHSATAFDNNNNVIQKFDGTASHHENFINAVRSRKHTDLSADILEGHLSSALCHTGNISYRLGRKASPEAVRESIKGDKEAEETFTRMAEHLVANGVDLNTTPAILGPVLKMNPGKETYKANNEANQMLTREYRSPYIVPEKV
ncbi:MAG: Gfo/Idh/MocA family oxidoreductase [Verrucomicrobiota bacterium]|nr:Gfo/Idh/MocA family oxidoreductase [Verrucomicrobiota bacterium]